MIFLLQQYYSRKGEGRVRVGCVLVQPHPHPALSLPRNTNCSSNFFLPPGEGEGNHCRFIFPERINLTDSEVMKCIVSSPERSISAASRAITDFSNATLGFSRQVDSRTLVRGNPAYMK